MLRPYLFNALARDLRTGSKPLLALHSLSPARPALLPRPAPASTPPRASSFHVFAARRVQQQQQQQQQQQKMASPLSPTIKLNSGAEMPQVGFGLWKVENKVCAETVYNAIKAGYRLFDGACDYGNEKECGEGVARAIKEGLVKRSDLFLVSKLWNSFHDPERVEPVCRRQLADWGIDYFDLYIVHFPVAIAYVDPATRYPPGWHFDDAGTQIKYSKATLEGTWHAMEDLVGAGLARNIGISNYNGALLLDLLAYARTVPATLQIEHHPYLAQPRLVTLARENGIAVTAYSSFGPQSFHDLDMAFAKDYPPLFQHELVKRVADKNGRSPAQVLLRWATQRGLAVIPKSSSPGRLAQNLDVTAWDLPEEDMKEITGLDRGLRFNDPVNYGLPIYMFA